MSSGALLTSGAVLLQTLLSFLFFCSISLLSFVHSEPINGLKKLAYPINNFLILCYHLKLLRVMLNTFCFNNFRLYNSKKVLELDNLSKEYINKKKGHAIKA